VQKSVTVFNKGPEPFIIGIGGVWLVDAMLGAQCFLPFLYGFVVIPSEGFN
jgi:hypothetical protein